MVRVGVPAMYARVVLIPAMESFLARHPDIKLSLVVCEGSPDPIAQKLDLWVQFGMPSTTNYITKVIYAPPIRLVAAPEYLAKHPKISTPEDLARHNCLHWHHPHSDSWYIYKLARKSPDSVSYLDRQVGNARIIDNIDLLYDAARAGLGVMSADLGMIVDDLLSERLQIVLPEYWTSGNYARSGKLSLFYDRRLIMTQRMEIVKDFLIESAGAMSERLKLIKDIVPAFDPFEIGD